MSHCKGLSLGFAVCRPTFQQITKELQLLYQECRKKPLQSAASAPAKVIPDSSSTAAPPTADAPPLRVRPTTADVHDLTLPRVGQSAFRSVTEPQKVSPRSRAGTISEQNERPPSPFGGPARSRQATVSENNEQPASPFAAPRHAPLQAPPPPSVSAALVRSPFDGIPDDESSGHQATSTSVAGNVPSLEEVQQRMAAAPVSHMPPESMMRANPRSSLGWRNPAQVLLQMSNRPTAGDSTAGQKLQ